MNDLLNTTDYLGGHGTECSWRQCRWCLAYIEWANSNRGVAKAHTGNCPLGRLEHLEAVSQEKEP